jgi:hypothetical protein
MSRLTSLFAADMALGLDVGIRETAKSQTVS